MSKKTSLCWPLARLSLTRPRFTCVTLKGNESGHVIYITEMAFNDTLDFVELDDGTCARPAA